MSIKNPPELTNEQTQNPAGQDAASSLVAARREARPLTDFPGMIPVDLDSAYRIQDTAIDLWGENVGGWKVGRIPLHLEDSLGIDRLGGPIFSNSIRSAESGSSVEMPIYVGGFAAIEAEYVAVIGRNAPANKIDWSIDEANNMIGEMRIGIEVASSPLGIINELGPAVVASDFGNNFGLVVGPIIKEWRTRALETMHSRTSINEQMVGEGGAYTLTGGFVRSVQFLLELAARRGRPLRKGDVIATGQTTGIHDIDVGQTGFIDFGDDGKLYIRMIAANPTG